MQYGGGERAGACPWCGARGRRPHPPLEIGKKMLSEEILTSFTYVLLMKLRGDRYTIHVKWKRWADRRLSMVGGANENKKRKGEYWPISAVGDE